MVRTTRMMYRFYMQVKQCLFIWVGCSSSPDSLLVPFNLVETGEIPARGTVMSFAALWPGSLFPTGE